MACANCPTTEQLCELFAQIAAGRVTGKNLQPFLQNPDFLKPREGMSIEEAWQIPNLVVIGPEEIADLFKISLESIPNPLLAITREQLEAKIAKRGNKLGLILRLKKISQRRNSLFFLNNQFGKEGKIKKGLLYSDEYVGDKKATFAYQLVCQIKAEWVLADLELPEWSFRKEHSEQKVEAANRGLRVKITPSDVFDLLLAAAVIGEGYRQDTWGRTADTCEYSPVIVGISKPDGLRINYDCCGCESDASDWTGLSCEEVVS